MMAFYVIGISCINLYISLHQKLGYFLLLVGNFEIGAQEGTGIH